MKIYISPSTQEHNIGKGNYGTEEKRMNEIADKVMPYLKGHVIYRNKPAMTLSEVVKDSNAKKPDIHVAIHSNAGGGKARGCEVLAYMQNGKITNSQKLAESIYKELSPLTPTNDRGIKNGVPLKLAEVVKVNATSVIIEIAFHDNEEDAKWIISNEDKIAKAIATGILNYGR